MNEQVDLATAQALIGKALEAAGADAACAGVAAVVVDRGGHVVASARMDGVSFVMSDVARRKATMAAAMGASTAALGEMAASDPVMLAALTGNSDTVALGGGAPIMGANGPVGGLGISGGHYSADQVIADKALT